MSKRPRLQGRDLELSVLTRCAHRIGRGLPGILLVTGEPGSGRTRLMEALHDLLTDPATGGVPVVVVAAGPEAAQPRSDGSPVAPTDVAAWATGIDAHRNGPCALLVDDVERLSLDGVRTLHGLITSLDTRSLLVAVTARTPLAEDSPVRDVWLQWEARPRAIHLALGPLPPREIRRLVATVAPGLSPWQRHRVTVASAGNVALAIELSAWSHGSAGGPGSQVARRVVTEPACAPLLEVLAVSQRPLGPAVMEAALGVAASVGRALVDAAVHRGLVLRSVVESTEVLEVSHPLYRQTILEGLSTEQVRDTHRRIGTALAQFTGAEPCALDAQAAHHFAASGQARQHAARHGLRAALWAEASDRPGRGAVLAAEALPFADEDLLRCMLLRARGRCLDRTGDRQAARECFVAALSRARRAGAAEEFVLTVLDLRASGIDATPEDADLTVEARRLCPKTAHDLRARLMLQEALDTRRAPGGDFPTRAAAALTSAAGSRDLATLAEVVDRLAAAAPPQLLPLLAEATGRVRHAASRLRTAALPGLAYTALAHGRRDALEVALADVRERPGGDDTRTRLRLETLAGVLAVLDLDGARLRSLTAGWLEEHPERELHEALPLLWSVHVGDHESAWTAEHIAAGPSAAAPGDAPCTPTGDAVAAAVLRRLGRSLLVAEAGTARERNRLLGEPGGLPPLGDVPTDETWAVSMLVHSRLAARTEDYEAAERLVTLIGGFVDEFVVLPPYFPVAPFGHALAELHDLLAHPLEAIQANDRALATSRELNACAWIVRCLIQRAHLLARTAPLSAIGALAEARSQARATGLTHLSVEIDELLRQLSAPQTNSSVVPLGDARAAAETHRTDDVDALLALVCDGMTNAEIARSLYCSIATVERRLSLLYRQAGVRNRAQFVATLRRSDGGFSQPGVRGA